ncbi:Acidic phosphoprotein precursor PCEMA1, putative [Plasmodium chabaudi adami]|uniref:Acidic phosphoprotein PCEMA1, putative n=1 Tax=Plasmodium chabaudi adami TaxID=5826 RepID=A0A1D3L9Y2_PLACE|nr:Acidic phosphoprotein precursor PCEMA1, putative [Plasmodium chabaudi adami]
MNKFYIQIVFFLLSVSVYLNNKTLATEAAPENATKTKSNKLYLTSEEIYEQNKELLCTNPEEIENAEKLMNEAIPHLEYHINNGDYKLSGPRTACDRNFCITTHEDTIFQRVNFKYKGSDKYNEMINLLWDPALANYFNISSVERKIKRVYNPNLILIQQRYKKDSGPNQKYFYALVKKAQISEDKTIIVMVSPNINDGYPSDKEYKNNIIENANLFKIDIDSEDDIKNGEIEKTHVNVAGYIIEHRNWYININYCESIDGLTSNDQELFIRTPLINLLRSI